MWGRQILFICDTRRQQLQAESLTRPLRPYRQPSHSVEQLLHFSLIPLQSRSSRVEPSPSM